MTGKHRWRQLASVCAVAVIAMALTACEKSYPNTTFIPHTEFSRASDDLWDLLLLLGTIVFVLVEAVLIFVVIRYRHRGEDKKPPQTHGNTTLEILWTLIPAVILVFIAVPTVKTIFYTQKAAAPGSLEVEVIGHQWWWEFRYPEYKIVTANELYVPIGRTVNFTLHSADVIHSFWTPQLGGKRDVVTNRTNHIWYTPDSSLKSAVWNGFCAEYCGDSHANMKFRVFTVQPDEFASWVAGQQKPAAFGAVAAVTPAPQPVALSAGTGAVAGTQPVKPATDTLASTTLSTAGAGYIFPADKIPSWSTPHTPLPKGLNFNSSLKGDATRGQQIYSSNACIACHAIAGNPMSVGTIGPNLTHMGSRYTLAAGSYPNDTEHLARWIKNAPKMKPGSIMPTLGKGEYDPKLKTTVSMGLDDQQIADIVAYLQALK
jgi:cytochrome c oxidase subunit 2